MISSYGRTQKILEVAFAINDLRHIITLLIINVESWKMLLTLLSEKFCIVEMKPVAIKHTLFNHLFFVPTCFCSFNLDNKVKDRAKPI